jgi:hypothetical protein
VDPRLAVIALILFVNNLGSGLILPLLPFYAIDTGASPLAIGVLIATLRRLRWNARAHEALFGPWPSVAQAVADMPVPLTRPR